MPNSNKIRESITSTLANTLYATVGVACYASRKTVQAYGVVHKEGKAFVDEVKVKYQDKREGNKDGEQCGHGNSWGANCSDCDEQELQDRVLRESLGVG